MEALRTSQLRAALGVVGDLAEVDRLEDFPQRVSEGLRRLLPCQHAGYTAVELGTGNVHIAADPEESVFDGGPEVFARFAHQNPLLSNLASGRERRAGRLSDYLTRRQLHSTDLYNHVYRHTPVEYQIGAPLAAPGRELGHPGELVGVSLVRVDRDFADDELALLGLLAPQLSAILTRLHELALLRATAATAGLDEPRWIVLVDPQGTVAWSTRPAADALELGGGARLPFELRRLLARGPDSSQWGPPLALHGMALQARVVANAYPGLDAVHLRPLSIRPTLASLRRLGLTQRQAEVFQLALTGRSGSQIAEALSLSPRTVEKHMLAVYRRLGAANRTEAVIVAVRGIGA